MRKIYCGFFCFCLLVLGTLQEGCTSGAAYQKETEYVPYLTDIPPTFYNNDPGLRHWYVAPYWHPTANGE